MANNCSVLQNTKDKLLREKTLWFNENQGVSLGLEVRQGEIVLTKENFSEVSRITNGLQNLAEKKYGLPRSRKLFSFRGSTVNQGKTMLILDENSFRYLQQLKYDLEAKSEDKSLKENHPRATKFSISKEVSLEKEVENFLKEDIEEINKFIDDAKDNDTTNEDLNFSPIVLDYPDSFDAKQSTKKNALLEAVSYKEYLITQNKKYLYEINVALEKNIDTSKRVELLQAKARLQANLYGDPISGAEGLIAETKKISDMKTKYSELVEIRKNLEVSLTDAIAAGRDTAPIIDDINKNAYELYQLKYKDFSTELFRATAITDIARAKEFLTTNDLKNLARAKDIIDFYTSVDPLNTLNNPFFSKEELESEFIKGEDLSDFHEIANEARALQNNLRSAIRGSIMSYINSLDYFKGKKGGQTFQELEVFLDSDGMLDINKVDSWLSNIGENAFSKSDTMLMNVLFKKVQDAIFEEQSNVKEISDEFDERTEPASNVLIRLGYTLRKNIGNADLKHKILSKVKTIADYSLFKQVTKEGLLRNRLVQRESDSYTTLMENNKSVFERRLNYFKENPQLATAEAITKTYFTYFKNIRENNTTLKPHLIPELANEFSHLIEDEDGMQPDNGEYVNELKELLGEKGYEEYVNKQKTMLDNFIIDKDQKEQSFLAKYAAENDLDISDVTLDMLDPEEQDFLYDWYMDNNPFNMGAYFDTNTRPYTRVNPEDNKKNYMKFGLEYSVHIPRKHPAKMHFTSNAGTLSFRKVEVREDTTKSSEHYDERFKVIEEYPELKAFWDTAMKSSDYYRKTLDANGQQNWRKGDLPIDDSVELDKFKETTSRTNDLLTLLFSKPFRYLLKKASESISSTVDLPEHNYKYSDNNLHINTASLGSGESTINQEINILKATLLKHERSTGIKTNTVETIPVKILKEALFLQGDYSRKQITEMSYDTVKSKVVQTFNITGKTKRDIVSGNIVTTHPINILDLMRDLHTQNSYKQSNSDLNLSLLKSVALASVIKARKDNSEIIQFMVNSIKDIKEASTTTTNSRTFYKREDQSEVVDLKDSLGSSATSQVDNFVESVVELRGGETKKRLLLPENTQRENLRPNIFHKFFLAEKANLEELDVLLNSPELSPEEKIELNKIKLQKMKYPDASRLFIKPSVAATRFTFLAWRTIANIKNLAEGFKAGFIHDATGHDWETGTYHKAASIIKGAILRNFTKYSEVTDKTLTPDARKARFIIDRLDFLEDASSLESKALRKTKVGGAFENLKSLVSPYGLITSTEYLNQGVIAITNLMNTKLTRVNKETGEKETLSIWDAYDSTGKLSDKDKYTYTQEDIDTWDKFKGQKAYDFKGKLNNSRNKTAGDYSKLGESRLNSSFVGAPAVLFKKWMYRHIAQMYGTTRYDYDTGKEIKGRLKSLSLPELILYRLSNGAVGKGFGASLLWTIPFILAVDIPSHFRAKPQDRGGTKKDGESGSLRDMVDRMALLTTIAMKASVGLPINTFSFFPKYNINVGKDNLGLENKLLGRGYSAEDLGNIKACGVELGLNMIKAATIIGLYMMYSAFSAEGGSGDDEEDKKDERLFGLISPKEASIVLLNTVIPLHEQGQHFLSNPFEAVKSISSSPIMGLMERFEKITKAIDAYIDEPNEGNSVKVKKTTSKVLPLPARDIFNNMEKVYNPQKHLEKVGNKSKFQHEEAISNRKDLIHNIYMQAVDLQEIEDVKGFLDMYDVDYGDGYNKDEDREYTKEELTKKLKNSLSRRIRVPRNIADYDRLVKDSEELLKGNLSIEDWNNIYAGEGEDIQE